MAEFNITDSIDITDVNCPITFVKAKIALEELDDGDILSIKLNDGEPVQNVPKSIKEEGHKVLSLTDNGDGTFELIVQKVGDGYACKDKQRRIRQRGAGRRAARTC